jgi:hypothetical protein
MVARKSISARGQRVKQKWYMMSGWLQVGAYEGHFDTTEHVTHIYEHTLDLRDVARRRLVAL